MKQFTVYDDGIEQDHRPCRYRFHRYVGQLVNSRFGVCEITEIISHYYTLIRDKHGRIWSVTPHDISERIEDDGKGDTQNRTNAPDIRNNR